MLTLHCRIQFPTAVEKVRHLWYIQPRIMGHEMENGRRGTRGVCRWRMYVVGEVLGARTRVPGNTLGAHLKSCGRRGSSYGALNR